MMKWLWTKRKMIQEIKRLHKLLNTHNNNLVVKIEELDQDKKYLVEIPGATEEDIQDTKDAFNEALKSMKWTCPDIMFTNLKFKKED